jgi:hypothetical protein
MSALISKIPFVKDGETFSVGGVEFIKFPEVNGTVPAVAKDIIFSSRFGDDNDLRSSDVLKKLEVEFMPKIIEAIGADNLCTIKTDLTTLDGLKPYGVMESLVSLPTFDFYRANAEVFDKHPVSRWWWLSTPESAAPHSDPDWVACVAPSGYIASDDYCNGSVGVRPFLSFNSSIFESSAQ